MASVKIKVEGNVSSGVGEEVVQVLSSLMELASSGSVVVNTLGPTFPRLATSLLRLGEQCGRMEELQALLNTSLSAWLHQSTCVLPNNIFSLAMSHSWPGCWSLARTLSRSSISPFAEAVQEGGFFDLANIGLFQQKWQYFVSPRTGLHCNSPSNPVLSLKFYAILIKICLNLQ